MKRFVGRSLLFLLFAACCYVFLLVGWQELGILKKTVRKNMRYRIGEYGHTYSRMQELDTTKGIDLLFIGSSHAYRGFDTRLFDVKGIRSFNMGSSSQTPKQTVHLLQKYWAQLQPKAVVFEVYPLSTFELDGTEAALDIISNSKVDRYALRMALEVNQLSVYNTLIYTTYSQLFTQDAHFVEPMHKNHDTYISGGYVEKDMWQNKNETNEEEKRWQVLSEQQKAFDEIIRFFEAKGIPFLLVWAPINSKRYQSYQNNNEMDSIFASKGNYLNYNQRLNLNDSLDFYDVDHLNLNGVNVFNCALIEQLDDLGWFYEQGSK
jgi:hypothetical protein